MSEIKLPYPVVVGGHICLDIIPTLHEWQSSMEAIFEPGKLVDIGPAVLTTGGAVSNTGIALHRLGVPVTLMGKVGDDLFGRATLDIIGGQDERLIKGMIVAPREASSYTIVISPPGVDRVFLHCTGTNDTFGEDDLKAVELREAGLFHFGYPPLMKRMYQGGGSELAGIMAVAKSAGSTTSLDLAKPDPASDAGRADWREILRAALPHVDLFLPSFEEILFMLHRELYDCLQAEHGTSDLLPFADSELLSMLAEELLGMGVAVVVLKLGEYGLYMKTTTDEARFASFGKYRPKDATIWAGRELYTTCYQVDVTGTTGAGDCTIAGFLAGWVQGLSPEAVLVGAVGVGACNVEHPDATSGIPHWSEVQHRIDEGWVQHEPKLQLGGFLPSHTYLGVLERRTISRG
ncbi:carbohydrate kinase family protein [Paenibacillus oryzisoli]|uniref:carbohydrate kinase family protein n=1 Tax=Paenibacillus oryzisoli TaxID=1850517 RepID=UPI003D2A25D7